ncbi:MAG: biopolymer transporter ExbD [Spirochaetes bacterium]|nr:biopolymer transporter ExbD [Spirochaetota bacterium]
MGMPSNGNKKLLVDINITPFTDVVLVLLIIFMVATPLIYQNTIKINLPASKTREVDERPRKITVMLDKDGVAYVNNKPYAITNEDGIEVMQNLVHGLVAGTTESSLIIKGDKDTRYDYIVTLVDIAKQEKIKRVLLETKAANAAKPAIPVATEKTN